MSAPAEQRSARVMNRTRVSVVVPVFSNLQHLPELYQRLTKTLERRVKGYDLVFVDDASRDGSVEWLRECAGRDERVRVVEMPENRGQHRAVVEGLSTAQGDVVVVLDADLQDPPEEIPRLLQALGDDDGVVFAKRGSRFESRTRYATSFVFKRILRMISGSRIPKDTGMFFAASRRTVTRAVQLASESPYVPLLLDHTGYPLASVQIDKVTRTDGQSTYTTSRRVGLAVRALREALRWRAHRRPPHSSPILPALKAATDH